MDITKRAGVLVWLGLLLSGCAVMSEDECLSADWHLIGYEDGVAGLSSSYVTERREACAKHDITLDFESYRAGRGEGLEQYCVPSSGFRLGHSGRNYNGACVYYDEAAFLGAYRQGRDLRELEQRVSNKRSELASARTGLDEVAETILATNDDIVGVEELLADYTASRMKNATLVEKVQVQEEQDNLLERRTLLTDRLMEDEREQRRLRALIPRLEGELSALEDQLAEMRAGIDY